MSFKTIKQTIFGTNRILLQYTLYKYCHNLWNCKKIIQSVFVLFLYLFWVWKGIENVSFLLGFSTLFATYLYKFQKGFIKHLLSFDGIFLAILMCEMMIGRGGNAIACDFNKKSKCYEKRLLLFHQKEGIPIFGHLSKVLVTN